MQKFAYPLLLACFCLSLFAPLSAQSVGKDEKALHELMASGFLKAYKDYRYEAEMYVALFKAKESEWDVTQQIRMKAAYRRTSEAFESFIYVTRNDLLDAKTRRSIRKDPETYVRQRLQSLDAVRKEYYDDLFLATYSQITQPESGHDGSEGPLATLNHRETDPLSLTLALLGPITQATVNIVNFIDEKKEKNLEAFKAVAERADALLASPRSACDPVGKRIRGAAPLPLLGGDLSLGQRKSGDLQNRPPLFLWQ